MQPEGRVQPYMIFAGGDFISGSGPWPINGSIMLDIGEVQRRKGFGRCVEIVHYA
jgi:hypothetical protein